jgi:hypothetical protein
MVGKTLFVFPVGKMAETLAGEVEEPSTSRV